VIQHAHPSRPGEADKPGTLPASRPERIGQLYSLMAAFDAIHRKDQLERIREHCDGHGGPIGAFIRPPHPGISREWIQVPPSSEVQDVEGVVLGREMLHVCRSNLA
jgi:hypothetical protein